MKQALIFISLFVVFIISFHACKSNETKHNNDFYIGHWYFQDYKLTDSISDYGEILFTDSTFTIAYIFAGIGPICENYKIRNDSIYISGKFKYLIEKIDQNSFTLKYHSSDKDCFTEMKVKRMEKHQFELKEEFENFEELDNYTENAWKRNKKYIDEGN
jgi:hypothetical protein